MQYAMELIVRDRQAELLREAEDTRLRRSAVAGDRRTPRRPTRLAPFNRHPAR
jgi:hypothetical protein